MVTAAVTLQTYTIFYDPGQAAIIHPDLAIATDSFAHDSWSAVAVPLELA